MRNYPRRAGRWATPCDLRLIERTPQARLQQVEATFEPLPYAAAARSYGQIVAAAAESGRSHRRRIADLLIAATAHANGLPIYTRTPDDFGGLGDPVHVIGI